MPNEVSGRISSFVQSVARFTARRDAGQSRKAQEKPATATNGTDRVDLTGQRDLPQGLQKAAGDARSAQARAERAREVVSVIRRVRSILEEIRARMSDRDEHEPAGIGSDAVQDDIDSIQSDLSDAAQQIPPTETEQDGDPETPGPIDGTTSTIQITITGAGAGSGGVVQENTVAIGQSLVAQDAGLTDVRLPEAGANAVFRLDDSGNGFVTATRYEVTDGGFVETGSQMVALRNFRNGGMVDNASETLNFDRLGLQMDIGTAYTPGDLNRVEVSVQTPMSDQAIAAQPAETSVTDAAGPVDQAPDAAAAVRQQLAALVDLADRLSSEAQTAEQLANQDVAHALGEIASAGPAELEIDTQTLERQLRAALLGG